MRLGDENSRLKGQHEVLTQEANHYKSQYAKIRTAGEANIAAANERIEELVATEIEQSRTIERLEAYSGRLEEAEPVYPEMDTHPLVLSLRTQLQTKDVVIIELKGLIDSQDKIILEVNGKFRIERDLRVFAEAGWAREAIAHDVCKKLAKRLETDIKRTKFFSGVKNVVVLTAAGAITYLVITK